MPERPFDLMEPPPPTRAERWSIWFRVYGCSFLGTLGGFGLLAFILVPVFLQSQHKAASPSSRCLSNVKQMGIAVLMYSQDYDDRYMSKESWMDAAYPYPKNERVFHCPALDSEEPDAYGYALNGLLSRLQIKRVPIPDQTPLVFDSDPPVRNAFDNVRSLPKPGRHRDGNNIGYADGHVKWTRDTVTVDPFPKKPAVK